SPIPEFYDLEKDFNELTNLAEKKELGQYQSNLAAIIKEQSQPGDKPNQRIDRDALEKLKSLGYISSRQVEIKENFTSEGDVKVMLPYHNRSSKALALYQAGKKEQAVDKLKEILTEKMNIDTGYLNLAKIYKETGELGNALEVLQLALDNLPSSYEIFLTYISYLLQAQQYDQVTDIFENKEYHRMRFDPEIWNSAGAAYLNKGQLEKAVDAFKEAISLDQDYPAAYNNLGNVYFYEFRKTKSSNSYQTAVYNFKKAIELDPEHANAYNGLGGAYLIAGQIEGAIYCLEKALEFNPGLDYALYNLGYAYLNKGDTSKAVELFEEYKQKAYDRLPPNDRRELDAIIQKYKKDQNQF
ncbi:MAG: tetratricopeptide repeat protein, partial [Candidatus Aminicenantes bacterium]|nr:tetratricopeptide repeat protein [Candidatus Aminicenantes bacterium]